MEIKQKLLGEKDGVIYHFIHNENGRFMINATDIAKSFNINLSEFLEKEETKLWIECLLKKDKAPVRYKVDGEEYESTIDRNYKLEDVILIDNGIYYFGKLLTYELCKPLGFFYWWMDGLFYELMKKDTNGLMYF